MKTRTLTERRAKAARLRPRIAPAKHSAGSRELTDKLAELVVSLREPYRTTLILRFFTNMSSEKIALRQGLRLHTIEKRIQHGLADLRSELDREFGRAHWAEEILPFCLS